MRAPFKPTCFAQKFLIILLLFFSVISFAQIKAFPTALGAGAYARGDVNYELYEVTNLNTTGPGSLWGGLGDNRIIVFRVSGIIDIPITATRSFSNCIVLGQTAPAPGITIVGNGWRWNGCQNVVFRYVRFRTWQCRGDLYDPCGVDNIDVVGLNGNENNNIIFDHCSFGFGGDEFLSFRGDTHTTTVQNCLFAYGKTGMLAGDSDDTSRGWDFSILNNFWHTIGKRTPNPNSNGRIDVIGNVTYNILNLGMRTSGSIRLNEIGNYYRRASGHRLNFGGGATPLIHTANNRLGNTLTENGQDNSVIWSNWLGGPDPEPNDFVDTPFPLLYYTDTLPDGDDALLAVQNRERGANAFLNNSGSPEFNLDGLDTAAYDQFDNDDYFDWDDGTGNSTQGSWELIPQRTWLTDNEPTFGQIVNEHDQGTHTGVVPNSWITNQGLDPANFDPLGNDLDATYTNIEIYSFGIDNAEVIAAQGVEITPATATINIPDTVDLDVVFTPDNTTNKSGDWSSSDESIATVDSNGVVTPVSEGTVTIIFISNDGGFEATAEVTVTNIVINATDIEVTPDEMTLDIGQTIQATVEFFPENTSNQNGTWSSNDPGIATVNQNGEVTGVSEGTTEVIFTSEDGGFTDTINVTVADIFYGTYEFFNAETDQFIQLITGDTTFDMAVIGNQVNFRVIPQGGDDNPNVDSVQVQWTGPEDGELVQSFPIYSGMADHSEDGTQFDSYFVSEGTYNFTITFWDDDFAQGNVISVDTFALTFFLDNGILANAGNDVSICEGESVTLTASGGDNYLWSTGETTASITVSPLTTTEYTVTVSNTVGDSDTDAVTVTVNPFPIAEITGNQTICLGDTTVLTAQGGDSYIWSTGETSQSISVNPAQDTTYSVEVISNGCSSSTSIPVVVNALPTISVSDDILIVQGESTTLTVSGADSYIWSTGETSDSITVSPTATTTYSVTGFNANNCEATAEVTVTVEELFSASAGENVRICQDSGTVVTLTASDGDSYLWNTGETTQSILVSPVSTSTYSVTVTLGNQQDTANVVVFVDPNPNVVITNGDSVDILDGDFITLSATGANTYEWNNGATQPNIAVSPSETTTYEVRGYVNDCYEDEQVIVNVFPQVNANAGEDVDICEGETITLTATGGSDYLWSNGETTASIQVSPSVTTDYSVTVFNPMDFDEDSVRVTVSPCDVVAQDPEDPTSTGFGFDIYPNPANDIVNIKINGSLLVSRIAIYDIMGKVVLQSDVENSTLSPSVTKEINVSQLRDGVYFVKMEDDENEIVRKLIVN